MKASEYTAQDATGLAALVARGEVTACELLDTALAAVGAVDATLNAVVATFEEEARRHIRESMPEDGPFRGVPFLLKDLTAHYGGQPTGAAWAPRLHHKAARDTELVRRYKAAGLVIFGKTAVPELAMDWSTESRAHGPTRNPWNTAITTGTSSGGSAAAVAAGIVPMAHGNDGGGSIRVPASCCGVFGMKPSRGRVPSAPDGDRWTGMLCEHALSASVRDSAALLDACAGPAPGQFYNAPAGAGFAAEVGREPGRLRIAVSTRAPYGAPTHRDCIEAVEDAVRLLEELGHVCEWRDIDLPEDGWTSFRTVLNAEYAADMQAEEQVLGRRLGEADFTPVTWEILEAGRRVGAVDYALAMRGLHRVAARVLSIFDQCDVFLSPALAKPPQPLGAFAAADMRAHYRHYLEWMPFTHIFNVSGSPAMSVPLHRNREGLPVGSQFAALPANEALLYRLAGQLERARPWRTTRPTVFYGD